MRRVVLVFACLLLAGCANYKLSYDQRANIQCRESGRDGRCTQDVTAMWNALSARCSARSPYNTHCNADFENAYWCRTKTKVEKYTNEKGEVTKKETQIEYGPGCMDSYARSKLKNNFMDDCMVGAPEAYDVEGASCNCGDYSCSVSLPFFFDGTIEKYYPNL